ncbi:MAG TPA: citrate/2-methylcitrate synthase [Trebonia sp.]|nr:citrate/2-methylcitrate synthase [Trebonia sp.]
MSRPSSPLTYHGYPVQELGRRYSFEEVAFLLWHRELPVRDQLLAQDRGERTAHLAGQPRASGIFRPRAPYHDRSAGHLAGEG